MFNHVPPLNAGGTGTPGNNYFANEGRYDVYNNYRGRLDLYASASGRMFVCVGRQGTNIPSDDLFMTLATITACPN